LRCPGLDAAEAYLGTLYGNRMTVTTFPSKEWDMIGVLGDGASPGEIPEKHRAVLDASLGIQAAAWNQRIGDSGRKTQNYDKGLERFVRKFDPDQEMEATIAIAKQIHRDHGLAVYFTQQRRRCLLLGTIYGHTDEEALWYTFSQDESARSGLLDSCSTGRALQCLREILGPFGKS
jgi:hypothetical protein